jgi:hypothetical protein
MDESEIQEIGIHDEPFSIFEINNEKIEEFYMKD